MTLGIDLLMGSHWAVKKESEIQGSRGIINGKEKKKTGTGVKQAHLNPTEMYRVHTDNYDHDDKNNTESLSGVR